MQASSQCKKIEIYIADNDCAQLVESLGFHCRGKKKGSCERNGSYYDEIGVDLSFFNIEDAKELLNLSVTDNYQIARVSSALNQCQTVISNALSENEIDQYAELYLENMAFQMVREGLGELAIRRYGHMHQEPAPWSSLIQELQGSLKEKFINLDSHTTKSWSPVNANEISNLLNL